MSVANSCSSIRPSSTVVGGQVSEDGLITNKSTCDTATRSDEHVRKRERDETYKRQMCAWFEKKLKLRKYLRDKRDEERLDYERFIRLNSKRLQCSYQIPADDIYSFMKRFYKLLSPGFRPVEDEKRSQVVRDWIACSDLTVQVFPKTPTVLWLDLECMPCKRGGKKEKIHRHFKSKDIIETIVRAVVDYITTTKGGSQTEEVIDFCDELYVTRGVTCGMHVFFPRVVCDSEQEMQEVWADVNRRLLETAHTAATVDTGCSAMPLPLSRDHSGLTRVEITRDGEQMEVRPFQLISPTLRDLVRVSNFHHLIADVLDKQTSSPSSSAVNSISSVGLTSVKRKHEETIVDSVVSPKVKKSKPTVDASEDEKDTRDSLVQRTSVVDREKGTGVTADALQQQEQPTLARPTRLEEEPPHTAITSDYESIEPVPVLDREEDERDERSSSTSSSSSSKRLVQTDIRALCAKAISSRRKRKRSGSEQNGSQTCDAGRYDEPILIVDDGDEEEERRRSNEDTASSFLCMGYAPSVRTYSCLQTTTTEEEEPESITTNRVPPPPPPPPRYSADAEHKKRSEEKNETDYTIVPAAAQLPALCFANNVRGGGSKTDGHSITNAKEAFEKSMRLRLDSGQNPVHETDTQLITSAFNAEIDFYTSMMKNSTRAGRHDRLRIKSGSSLNASRENCPSGLFPEYVPHVLYADDFVGEREWIVVLARYYDEYLNNAPFLYVMAYVLKNDENVKRSLNETTRRGIEECVQRCLQRFRTTDRYVRKAPYDEKCTIVTGLMAVCSLAFKMVTPVFTDLAKICRSLLGNTQQTCDTLNSSTMPTTSDNAPYDTSASLSAQDDPFLDESVSQVGCGHPDDEAKEEEAFGDERNKANCGGANGSNIGNDHSILASILRWNYDALDEQTLWCLFFYYYHVHSDVLARIMNEVVHGGLMVTAVLQSYFESFSNNNPVDMGFVCRQVFKLDNAFQVKGEDDDRGDRALMPPPSKGRGKQKKRNGTGINKSVNRGGAFLSYEAEIKRNRFEERDHNSKNAQRKVREERDGVRDDDEKNGRQDEEESNYEYKTSFNEVLSLVVRRYLRPVSFDETTVVYTEAGYEQRSSDFSSSFATNDKDLKGAVKDTFTRATLKYSMPHGDLTMFNTDVLGAVHRRSSCTNNLVLNVFENMYGGCMTYLTRRYNNNLKLFNRFNGDAYRLVVECRHATKEFIRSIELSYINLILRQPVVPPVLESDISIRHMFMSEEEIMKGAFVCLGPMDYVRSVNMFTRHCKSPQENCRAAESFLDRLITERKQHGDAARYEGDDDARNRFRTIYLFFLLYIFEVLYRIRHAYNRDRTYYVSIERLCWDMDIRMLLKLFFGAREFKMPRGLSAEALKSLDMQTDLYGEDSTWDQRLYEDDEDEEKRTLAARCIINTRPVVSALPASKEDRMVELFKKKGIIVMKSYAPQRCTDDDETGEEDCTKRTNNNNNKNHHHRILDPSSSDVFDAEEEHSSSPSDLSDGTTYQERDRVFLDMTQTKLEDALYSSATWYDNCRVRMKAVARSAAGKERPADLEEMCSMDAASMDTFLRTQLRVVVDNDRLTHIDRAVRENRDFAFCAHMPLRAKMMALVLATHSAKRTSSEVATDFLRKEYHLERTGVVRFSTNAGEGEEAGEQRSTSPDLRWEKAWNALLSKRKRLLMYCRSLADTEFPDSYFIGLRPDDSYNALYTYMLNRPQYKTLRGLQHLPWAKDVCVAMNFLLVMNAYDTELVDLCLRLFLGFEWPGQWAKRIFVWKSNSNAGKSFFFESIMSKVFDHSTTINDPKGGKDNAPEKSEYYKNFLLMINEFTTASSCELKKLCSMSGYKFRMNFGNQMIQAYMVGKMVFNCNTLPLTTDHATIQRVALIPLPFWFHKRQSVVDALLNWTIGQTGGDYEKCFRRKISKMLTAAERRFFIDNTETKIESDLFNEPDENALRPLNQVNGGGSGGQKTGASMFLVQNKTSQVYMSSSPATGTIVSGILLITRYFCRFRYFNKIKEPVDFSTVPTACTLAAREWERFSQPYYEWKERYRVERNTAVRTKVSVIHASLSHFAKNYSKNTSFFDLRQFFEVDFVDSKIQYYNTNREDEYYVRLDPLQD